MEATTRGSLRLRDAEGRGSELCNLPGRVSFLSLLLQGSLEERLAATTQKLALVRCLGCPSCLSRFTLHFSFPCCRMHEANLWGLHQQTHLPCSFQVGWAMGAPARSQREENSEARVLISSAPPAGDPAEGCIHWAVSSSSKANLLLSGSDF